ncbi:MAG TPA: ATP-binding protein [Terriglobales bacterium]|nr:ATP-binding protein [Terriglobales bacterium]
MAVNLRIVERRGRGEPLGPGRHLEISTLLEALPDPAFVCNSSGQVIEANPALEALTGIARERLRELTTRDLAQHLWISQDTNPVAPETLPIARALRGEAVKNESYVLRHPKREVPTEVLVSASPIRGSESDIIGALVVVRDVTEVAELKRNIERTERQRTVGQLAAGVAHDFNNVLDTIGQAGEVLDMKMDAPPEERKMYLSIIRGAVKQGAEMVSRVREFLSSRAARWTPLNVCQILEECTEMTRPLWEPTRVRLVRDFTPVGLVWGHPADLRRVFTNLIINALEAMPEGGHLTISCNEENGAVKVKVSDTGVGIAPEDRAKIFRPYFTTKAEGTGIGLSGAQAIVRAHNGDIGFDTAVQTGTTFWVTLPLMKRAEEAQQAS